MKKYLILYLSLKNIMNLLKLVEDRDALYCGVFLDMASRAMILDRVEIPMGWRVYVHHMTIRLGELPNNLKDLIGEEVELLVTHIGKSDKAIAFGIDTSLSFNKRPHITVAIDVENGGKPKDSNDIINWDRIKEFTVRGKIGEIYKN
jgi:hypothetical protein